MKTILLFILDKFADWEAAYLSSAVNMLGNGEFAVKTVSLTQEAVTSIGGFRTVHDFGLDTVPEDYEALILIGGMSWRTPEARGVSALAENCAEKGKLLGGICDASAFLGTLGLLNSVPHTSNDPNDLKQWGGKPTAEKSCMSINRLCAAEISLRQTAQRLLNLPGKYCLR